MSIRDARYADASSIAAISIEVWIGTYLKQGVNNFFADFALAEFTTANIESQLSDQSQFCLVSENEIGIDGFIRVSFGQEAPVAGCSDTEIATFYVQPRHHGKGIGKRLLKAAVERCRAKDIEEVWLTTNSENTPGIAFYLSQEFNFSGETHFRIDDQAYLNNVYSYSF
ncbi:MAG: GNAT family N-acetyltransferase [Planktomarina sp.]|jgi:ribosomal protein S18 acetylase RimI-like enzyme|nr:GNAT family N-acetyltransferase [Planktomarina sp.]|tara:strand:+ start:642 stop:1148 length:507 start_codon:yes stop_codon:yes gene_type:complete